MLSQMSDMSASRRPAPFESQMYSYSISVEQPTTATASNTNTNSGSATNTTNTSILTARSRGIATISSSSRATLDGEIASGGGGSRTGGGYGGASTGSGSGTTLASSIRMAITGSLAQSPQCSSNQPCSPSTPHRCTVSLLFLFIVPSIIIAAVFFSVTWATLSRLSVDSIETAASHLNKVLALHLTQSVEGFLQSSFDVASAAQTGLRWDSIPDVVQTNLFQLMNLVSPFRPSAAGVVDLNGSFLAIQRSDGALSLLNSSNASLVGSLKNTDLVKSNWFPRMMQTKVAGFLPSSLLSGRIGTVITVLVPILFPNASVAKVMFVEYSLDSISTVFESVQLSLQAHNILLLTDGVGSRILTSADTTLPPGDFDMIIASASNEEKAVSLSSVGQATVLRHDFKGNLPSGLAIESIDWRLYVVIRRSTYYSLSTKQDQIGIGMVVGCLMAYLFIKAILFRLLLTRPLRRLLNRLKSISETVYFFNPIDVTESHLDSRFTEIAELRSAVTDVIRAVQISAEQHAQELDKVAETEQMQAQAQRLMRSKELFFAMISHEMRTPLTSCIGMAEILLATSLTDQQRECIEAILFSGGSMLTLVNNLLDFSKLEADKLVLEKVPFCIREIIERAGQSVQLKAEEKKLELIVEVGADIPEVIIGDPHRLNQVVLNLLSNAVKFTSSGFVHVQCQLETAKPNFIRVEVHDTGIGIAPDALEDLFKPFVQETLATTRQFGGTGLGLTIARRIVALMGGQLRVQSDGKGKGSSVSFVIPFVLGTGIQPTGSVSVLPPPSPGPNRHLSPRIMCPEDKARKIVNLKNLAARALASPRKDRRISLNPIDAASGSNARRLAIYVVDAMEPRRKAICEMLRVLQLQYYEVNGLSHLKNMNIPDSVAFSQLFLTHLSDHPSSDAGRVVSSLRSTSTSRESLLRQVILFGNVRSPNVPAPLDHGVLCISRPVTLRKLYGAINKLFPGLIQVSMPSYLGMADANETPSASRVMAEDSAMTGSIRILIVDDVELNRQVIALKLKQRGYVNIDMASSGLEAVQRAISSPYVYDVILMDVTMPELDGCEATRQIKSMPMYARVPIVGVTGNCNSEDIEDFLASGMTCVLAKPINTDQLFSVLHDLVSQPHQQATTAIPSVPSLRSEINYSIAAVQAPSSASAPVTANPNLLPTTNSGAYDSNDDDNSTQTTSTADECAPLPSPPRGCPVQPVATGSSANPFATPSTRSSLTSLMLIHPSVSRTDYGEAFKPSPSPNMNVVVDPR